MNTQPNKVDFSLPYTDLGITKEATTKERVEALKEWLKNNSLVFYVELAEPIITDLTEEELAQFNAVHMNYPNTTIVNDAGAYTEVEYVCDTQMHIEQNYAPKSVTQDILARLSALEQNAVNS